MRLSFVVGSFYPAVVYGGPIYSMLNLATGLARQGVEVRVSTTHVNGKARLAVPTGEPVRFEEGLNVRYYGGASDKSFSWPYFFGLWRDIGNADVVYLQPIFSAYVPLAMVYARMRGRPVLLAPRGSLGRWCLDFGSRFKRLWLLLLIKPFAGYVDWHATSTQEEMEISSLFREARVHVVPNAILTVETPLPARPSRRDFLRRFTGVERDCTGIVISMGRLHAKKGFDILIDAFALLKKDFPGMALLIAGADFGEKDALLDRIKTAGLDGSAFLVGHLEGGDKADFLAGADVFALSSNNENFGNVYAEALAHGTPVVASRNTPWESLETEGCGKWVDNTAADFAAAILSILNSDAREMGARGRKHVQERFGSERVASAMRRVFEKMVEAGR